MTHHGRRKAKRVGVGKGGKKAAEAAAVQLRARLAQGDLSCFEETTAPPAVMTFETYARQWLSETVRPHRKARTADYYEQVSIHISCLRSGWYPDCGGNSGAASGHSMTCPLNDAWLRDRVWRPSLKLRRAVPIAYVSRQLGHSSIQGDGGSLWPLHPRR